MQHLTSKNKELIITLNVEDLTPVQVRLLKSLNALLTTVVTADDEAEYFDSSAELMRKAAEVIKNSDFARKNTQMNYGEQALEFAVDFLHENLEKKENLDN
jgi:erythromycin esterase-like protein